MENVNRRKFLKQSTSAVAAGSLITIANPDTNDLNIKNMFVHHVYFWLKNPASKEDRASLLKGLQTLPNIKAIKTAHIGVPADTDRPVIDTSYDFSLLLIFDNRKEQDVYQTHPIHLKFVEQYSNLWSKVIVYDSVNA